MYTNCWVPHPFRLIHVRGLLYEDYTCFRVDVALYRVLCLIDVYHH